MLKLRTQVNFNKRSQTLSDELELFKDLSTAQLGHKQKCLRVSSKEDVAVWISSRVLDQVLEN